MPSANRIILASAGSGKTTTIVSESARERGVRSALVTYTNNSEAELRIKANTIYGCVPPHLRTETWFGFLLKHLVRPYQRAAYSGRVRGLAFVNGTSARWTKEADTQRHYFERPGDIYVDKVSKFACKLIRETGGMPLRRLAQIVGSHLCRRSAGPSGIRPGPDRAPAGLGDRDRTRRRPSASDIQDEPIR